MHERGWAGLSKRWWAGLSERRAPYGWAGLGEMSGWLHSTAYQCKLLLEIDLEMTAV